MHKDRLDGVVKSKITNSIAYTIACSLLGISCPLLHARSVWRFCFVLAEAMVILSMCSRVKEIKRPSLRKHHGSCWLHYMLHTLFVRYKLSHVRVCGRNTQIHLWISEHLFCYHSCEWYVRWKWSTKRWRARMRYIAMIVKLHLCRYLLYHSFGIMNWHGREGWVWVTPITYFG